MSFAHRGEDNIVVLGGAASVRDVVARAVASGSPAQQLITYVTQLLHHW